MLQIMLQNIYLNITQHLEKHLKEECSHVNIATWRLSSQLVLKKHPEVFPLHDIVCI